jgi:hypothetical protein
MDKAPNSIDVKKLFNIYALEGQIKKAIEELSESNIFFSIENGSGKTVSVDKSFKVNLTTPLH